MRAHLKFAAKVCTVQRVKLDMYARSISCSEPNTYDVGPILHGYIILYQWKFESIT